MSPTLVVFAGFYQAARHTVQYANNLAQALHGKLVLLHVKRASMFDPYDHMAESFRQQELNRETDTAAALYRMAEELPTQPAVEVATDLLPIMAQDLAARHRPALFVLSQPDSARADASVARACAELLRAGHYPLLVVPTAASADHPPRRILIAADREPFTLTSHAQALQQMLALPGTELIVAHVSSGVEDDEGCSAALRAVQLSGLVKGLATPKLLGYAHDDYAQGVFAAVQDTKADLVIVLARERSYLGELFHHSVTAQLLAHCPVPVLVLPVAGEAAPGGLSQSTTDTANRTAGALAGLSPAS